MGRAKVSIAAVLAGVLWAVGSTGCVPDVGAGDFTCVPGEPDNCPTGWYCLAYWDEHRCYPERPEDTCRVGGVDPGEQCDGTDFERAPGDVLGCRDYFDDVPRSGTTTTLVCLSDCTVRCAWCGNGVVDRYPDYGVMEECDGSAGDEDCNPNCTVPRCGDGYVQPDPPYNEECDDGNFRSGDGCSGDCRSEEQCGNGYVDFEVGEQCDDGNYLNHDGCNSRCRSELPVWRPWEHPLTRGRAGPAAVYDPDRDRVVVFGGWDGSGYRGDTWEYDGSLWIHRTSPVSPPPRSGHALIYDPGRQRVVLYGGHDDINYLGDTWEWDGSVWTETSRATDPPARTDMGFAFDGLRERMVVFGGVDAGVMYDDTWVYGASGWEELPLANRPAHRVGAAMTWDASRQKVVLFSGIIQALIYVDDTWELDDQGWTQVTPALSPEHRDNAAMAFDASRGKVVLYGGRFWTGVFGDTWEFDGATWTPLSSATSPPGLFDQAMTYDSLRGRVVLYGGHGNGIISGGLWFFDAGGWAMLDPILKPPSRVNPGFAFDETRGVSVLFGGYDGVGTVYEDTWEFDGSEWRKGTPADWPSPRTAPAMAYDPVREVTVLFGGAPDLPSGDRLGDTWEYDGSTWTLVTPPVSPPARAWASMVYHPGRGRMVLFGGHASPAKLDDTWEYDGVTWENKTRPVGSPRPPARSHHAMAYVVSEDRLVLYGGIGLVAFYDTWEYVDTQWIDRTDEENHPPSRYGHAMVHESARDRLLLFGGGVISGVAADTWELDYVVAPAISPEPFPLWTDLAPSTAPQPRLGAAAVFDTWRQMAVLFGGVLDVDTWTFAFRSSLADEVCNNSVDDDGDGRVDCNDEDCWWFDGCAP